MKTGLLSLAAVSLLQLTVATPRQAHQHHKRANVVVTKVDTVTADTANVIVYVDQYGKPVSSTTLYHAGTKPTTEPQAKQAQLPQQKPPTLPSGQPKPSSGYVAPENPPSPPPADFPAQPPAKPSSDKADVAFGSAISYSPYNADGSCKLTPQVQADLAVIQNFDVIRLYGTDCDQVSNVIAATQGKNVRLFLGIFDINNVDTEAKTISSAVNNNWGMIEAITVGNEQVNSGKASANQVVAAIGTAKSSLAAVGYHGVVGTVDTMVAVKQHPELCVTHCFINCHAFFDGGVLPEDSGKFVLDWAQQVSQAAGGKNTIVTETGWPTQGNPNKQAIPGQENHQKAIDSIKSAFSNNMILFSAFNDRWKKDTDATFGAERFWGLYGDSEA